MMISIPDFKSIDSIDLKELIKSDSSTILTLLFIN